MRRRAVLRRAGVVLGGGAVGGASAGAGTIPGGAASDGAASFVPLGTRRIENAVEAVLGPDGTTAYVAVGDGFATVDVSDPAAPRVLAQRRDLLADHEDGPMRRVFDVAVDGDRLLVAGPANALESAVPEGVLLYDVSDPAAPQRLAFHETGGPVHNAFLHDGAAYVPGGVAGTELLVVDVGEDPERIARWAPADHDEGWNEVSAFVRPLHDLWVHDGTAFLACWDAGTFVLDVSDPAAPSYVSRVGGRPFEALTGIERADLAAAVIEPPGNHHYVQPSADGALLAIGMEAWNHPETEGGGPGGIELWDVSDPTAPTRRSTVDPPRAAAETRAGTWTTAHNFDLVGDRLYSSWYQGGVKIHDVSDPADPAELAWWRRPGAAAFWAARRAAGDHFVASATAATPHDLPAGLYTFPDRAGRQPDPPSLTATPTPTSTASPSPTPTPTASPSPTPTPTAVPAGPDTPSPTATTTDGLGVLAALAALAGAAWWRR